MSSTKECPLCGATRFEKHEIVEFDGNKEKTVRAFYVCQNPMCGKTSDKDQLRERAVETVLMD